MSQGNPSTHEVDIYAGEFVLHCNKSKAWRKAFPDSTAKAEVVHVAAQKMHNLDKVLVRIKEMQADQAEKDALEFDMSAHELKETLKLVMDLGLCRKAPEDGSESTLNLSAVNQSIQEFNRMNGNHAATKNELTGKNGGAIETSDISERELARRIAFTLAKGARNK